MEKFRVLLTKEKWPNDDSDFPNEKPFFHTLLNNLFKQRYISSVTSYKYLKNKWKILCICIIPLIKL